MIKITQRDRSLWITIHCSALKYFFLFQGEIEQIPGSEKSWSPGSDQGDNGQCPGRWRSVEETSEVDGQLNDDQAAHELCKTCTEKIDSAEPQRGTFSIAYTNRRIRIP